MSDDVRDAIIEQIERQYGRLMRKLAYEILHDEYEVEDVIQTALWEIIYKHIDKLNLPKRRISKLSLHCREEYGDKPV